MRPGKRAVRLFLKQNPDCATARFVQVPIPTHLLASFPACGHCESFWVNRSHSVQVYHVASDWGDLLHLMVRRHDELPIRSWAEMQSIKNEIVGAERTAVEVFPAESQLVDSANMYHLWVLPGGFDLPFSLRGHFQPKEP